MMEEEAPELRDVVCDTLTVELADTVLLAVIEEVPVPVGVPVPEAVGEAVTFGVALLLKELLPVFEEEAPVLSEAVGVTLTAVLAASVPLAVP